MRRWLTFLFLMLAPAAVLAAPTVSLEVEPRSGSRDDDFVMRITVSGAGELKYPELSGGDDFDIVLIGPEQQVRIVNGDVERSSSFIYRLTPKTAGVLQSPGASVVADGNELHAAPVEVTVAAERSAPPIEPGDLGEVFLRQFTDKNRVYVGEQLGYVLQVFQRTRISEAQLSGTTMEGVWQEELGDEKRSSTVVDGRRYDVTTVRKALFPLTPGEFKLPPATLNAHVPVRDSRRPRSPFPPDIFGAPFDFDDFFGMTRMRPVKLVADRPSISVAPLPTAPPKLPNWGQAQTPVGETRISVEYDPEEIGVGGSKTVQVMVESRGNVRPLSELPLPESPRYRIYQDTPAVNYELRGAGAVFKRSFRFTVVPSSGGVIEIPPLRLGYFDPESGSYEIAESPPIRFTVRGPAAPAGEEQPEPGAAEGPETVSGEPLLRYEEPGVIERLGRRVSLSLALLILAAAILFGAAIVLRWLRTRRIDLRTEALAQVEAAAKPEDLARAFKRYALKKIEGAPEISSTDGLRGVIERGVVDPNLRAGILLTLDALDEAIYSGGSGAAPAKTGELRDRVREVLERW